MNLHTMRLIAALPNRAEPKNHAAEPAVAFNRRLTLIVGRVVPSILAVIVGGHLLL